MINILFGAVAAAVLIAPLTIRKIRRLESRINRLEARRDALRQEALRRKRHYAVHLHLDYCSVDADDVPITQACPTRIAGFDYGDDREYALLCARELCDNLNSLDQ